MHTIWKGSISFGLVNIPIKLHAATEDRDVKLRNLHRDCHTPIKYEKVCPSCQVEIKQEEMVKGYEISKGKFVVIEQDELAALREEIEDKSVEIVDFIKIEEIDPIYFDKSYFLSPNEGGKKAYSLLRSALRESNKTGLAKISIRSKEQLAVIRVFKEALLMETIHFPDEVRKVEDVPYVTSESSISKKELDTALLLIDQLTTVFDPEKYHDEYRSKLLDLIHSRESGATVVTSKETATTNVTDLMAALQASIDSTKPKRKKRTTKKATKVQ
ncbi:DNA repair protein [Bacillus coahuilensis m2-6]|uniref:non-homologous end joining protein Ku n=1 Tax=Bacillus coahuilensis TaxID=408580 RepID=UPI00075009A6|nr:Ku protein [Bacillus coahuilensis]KUP08172.1 DNA repair protein [Bacillus coahuilensis m2-6]